MSKKRRVLFIGLDSAEPELLTRWSDEGRLPVLRALREQGADAEATTPPGLGNGAMWPTLFTGLNPGRHGRYFVRQAQPGSYMIRRFVEDSDFVGEPLWSQLSRAGRRVAVFDMVRAPLTADINGVQLADWMTHDRTGPIRSRPPELATEALEDFGADPLDGCSEGERDLEEYGALRDQLIDRIHKKTELSCRYLEREPWDLFMTVFADPHDVGHQCWHLHDPTSAVYDADGAKRVGNPIRDVYEAMDEAIGRMIEHAGPDDVVIVFSGPGMGPYYTGNHLLDIILRRLDGLPDADVRSLSDKLANTVELPFVKQVVDRVVAAMHVIDRRRRTFYPVPHNANSGAVRINLVGREPDGKVDPSEYEAVCADLTEAFLELKNLDTGGRVVDEVVRVADAYHGPCVDRMPDLLVVWNRDAQISSVGSDRIGEVHGVYRGSRTGDHTPRSMLTVRGPGIEPGTSLEGIAVEDIAPTITAMLGVQMPDVDGRPIAELLAGRPTHA